jgi:hypothetical protein
MDSPLIIFLILLMVANNGSVSSSDKKLISLAMIICVSISATDPKAIAKNCLNSFAEFLPCPSAILEGIDTAALLIWLVNP